MPTVVQLRAFCKQTGCSRYSRLRKRELLWLVLVCRLRRARLETCPLLQDSPSRPVVVQGIVFDHASLREYLGNHAVDLAHPVTRQPLTSADLDLLGLSLQTVYTAAVARQQRVKEIENLCGMYDSAISEAMYAMNGSDSWGSMHMLGGQVAGQLAERIVRLDERMQELCVTTLAQKRGQVITRLEHMQNQGTDPEVLLASVTLVWLQTIEAERI